eukprot:TRINITY_DN1521_c0_g1_i2.p2 TRINITY_DN1521_c0_g1~~TRINITY_DN1521_c0_g1_i2.p2  ORF type:complete len:221 (+),score=46.24 TRINITY_DN1521_c0_g1_i2:675-1337(+)
MLKLLSVLFFVCVCLSQNTICPSTDIGGFSQPCIVADEKLPYCNSHQISASTSENICVECISNCDCSPGKYCSTNPNEFGVCIKFEAQGKECYPYGGGDLLDAAVPDKYKCADLYPSLSNGDPTPNYIGSCIERKCRFCDPGASPANYNAIDCAGSLKGNRACVWPGSEHGAEAAFWTAGIYKTDRPAVWLALFFVLILAILVVLIIGTFIMGGDKKSPS